MTDNQAVIDALNRLPEAVSLEEITEELRILASIRRGCADIASGRSKSHAEVEQLVESWSTAWTSR
jgi:predicted transcriptional regulator